MWIADKIYYRNSDNFIRAYQGNELVWERPSNNKIFYTSIDGEVVTPYRDDFGANIVSNTYSGGVGVIEFDGDVTKIGNQCFNLTYIRTIVIPDSVTSIGDGAFNYCAFLTSINIPDGVTSIGNNAFNSCSHLSSITIPNSVTSIGAYAFLGCDSLSSINIPDGVTSIGNNAFNSCSHLSSITIPDSVTSIGDAAFSGCTSLQTVIFESTTPPTTIGSAIFDNNASGRLIYVPISALQAYKTAFPVYENDIVGYGGETIFYKSYNNAVITPYNSTVFGANLVSNTYTSGQGIMTFDGTVTSIGNSAFKNCSNLTNIDIPEGVTSIGVDAFTGCTRLTSIHIPAAVTSIDITSYNGCSNIESITVDPNNTYFDSRNGCNAIIRVTTNNLRFGCKNTVIPNTVATIGNNAFYGRNMKTNGINIPSSVTSITVGAFQNVTGMVTITIPSSVTSIGNNAFYNASDLERVYVNRTTPPTLGTSVFYGEATGRVIIVPQASLNTYKTATRWQNYNPYIIGDQSVIHYTSTDSRVITPYGDDWGGVTLVSNTYTNNVGGVMIFDGPVTEIGNNAFLDKHNLTSITIPDSVTSIDREAFYGCDNLTSITIPDSVTSIGSVAFLGCSSLTSYVLSSSMTIIDIGLFNGCSSLQRAVIPSGITRIDVQAYRNCTQLSEVIVYATVPPVLNKNSLSNTYDQFENNAQGRKIYVPAGSLTAYQTATGWSDYASDIEAQ